MANYRGLKKIKFIYHGDWADPELIYKKTSLNYYDIDDVLYDNFVEDLKEKMNLADAEAAATDQNFNEWINKHKSYCYLLIIEIFLN